LLVVQKRDSSSVDSLTSQPALKRKKLWKILDSDDSSDEASAKSSAKRLNSCEQAAAWKIDRLKASLQKPASQPKDVEPTVEKQSKDVAQIAADDKRSKESKDKARKEDWRRTMDKSAKKLGAVEAFSKTPETQAEDWPHKDASGKYAKHNELDGSKTPEKANKNDAKQRQSYVIPKLKKPVDNMPGSSPVLADTWSDMLKRGAELEKNRPKQMTPHSAGMRRIPKIIPKAGLCGKADVGVLDKIEKHPGFLRWQQATPQKNTSQKTEDERNSVATKSKEKTKARQQTSVVLGQETLPTVVSKPLQPVPIGLGQQTLPTIVSKPLQEVPIGLGQQTLPAVISKPVQEVPIGLAQQTLSTADSKPLEPLVSSSSETSQPPTTTRASNDVVTSTSTKSLLSMPAKSTLLSAPPCTRKKALLPTPGIRGSSSTSAAPIPVLLRRGADRHSRSRVTSSPATDDDHFVPEDTASHAGHIISS